MDLVYLCVAALLAGFVDAIVGGGGLIQLPALFIFLPPELSASTALVFGTNKLSSICGTSVAAFQYSRRIPVNWASILPAGLAAFVFSFLGARLVSMLDGQALRPLILFLLCAVAFHTYRRKDFGNLHAPKFVASHERQWGIVLGIGIGFYDGFFGPGTGSFLLFVFIGVFGFDFLTASASAKVINAATNLAAVVYFGSSQNILYEYALPMGLCNIVGSVAGTRLAILKGNQFVRLIFQGVVTAMILRFGWKVLVAGPRALP